LYEIGSKGAREIARNVPLILVLFLFPVLDPAIFQEENNRAR